VPLDEYVKAFTLWLSMLTEGFAGLIIGVAILEAFARTVLLIVSPSQYRVSASHEAKEDIRLRLGRWLALALEFLLAADILRTAVAPTWSEIGQLAAIAAIRTALNYFLQQEIDKANARRAPDGDVG
jgi:uncharacterized membrane protein